MSEHGEDQPPAAEALPLARYERLDTRDVDEARELVARDFCAHQLLPLTRHSSLHTRFHSVRLGGLGLHYLDYGAEVRVAPGELRDFFLVLLPLAGAAEVTSGNETVLVHPSAGAIPAPDRKFVVRWGAGNRQLIVRADRGGLERHLSKMLGKPLTEPLMFDLGVDMTAQTIRSWRNVVDLLCREVDAETGPLEQPLAMRELERLVFSRLLLAQPSNYSAALHREPMSAAPKMIKRATELIEAHAAEPLTVEDIAEAVGVSVRALQEGFRRHFDTTPMNHLREIRLRRVHTALKLADPAHTTVTDLALQWGFLHLGRFSVQYRQRFGELPSATLRG
ncbi:AraC family transcriptional regulator [Kribbella sp. NPDC051620]|uniref:AraC family transcriptional regulator n=1 Tax=Kribbella sp. NPDC051620 TaxID=3364120 RepID=UPI0037AE626D